MNYFSGRPRRPKPSAAPSKPEYRLVVTGDEALEWPDGLEWVGGVLEVGPDGISFTVTLRPTHLDATLRGVRILAGPEGVTAAGVGLVGVRAEWDSEELTLRWQ